MAIIHFLEVIHKCIDSFRCLICSVDVSYEGSRTWSKHSSPKLLIKTTTRTSLVLSGANTTEAIDFSAIASHIYRIFVSVLAHGNRSEGKMYCSFLMSYGESFGTWRLIINPDLSPFHCTPRLWKSKKNYKFTIIRFTVKLKPNLVCTDSISLQPARLPAFAQAQSGLDALHRPRPLAWY